MICEKCGKEFQGRYSKWVSGRFCSRSCANARIHSKETKLKISQSLVGNKNNFCIYPILKCKNCQKDFQSSYKREKFCSLECSRGFVGNYHRGRVVTDLQRQNISNGRKKAFEENKIKVTGGTTKWIQYKSIKVQGSFEYRFCVILDKLLSEGKIKNWSYATERIKYIGLDKREHVYIIDFTVERLDDTKYFVEVKGFLRPNDLYKINCAIKSGRELYIAFDKQIKEQEARHCV